MIDAPPFTSDSATFAILEKVATFDEPVRNLLNVEIVEICWFGGFWAFWSFFLSSVFDIAFNNNKMDESELIDRAIDKTHLQSTRKVIPHVQKVLEASSEQITSENKTRTC